MKTNPAFLAPKLLTHEGAHVQPLGDYEAADSDVLLEGMEIRADLCAALAELSTSMRGLLGLMSRHNFITVLPDASFPAYERFIEQIGNSVIQASVMMERSRALDCRITLTYLPPTTFPQQ